MKVFELQNRFHPRTGKKGEPELVQTGWLCDFCGRFHSDEEYEADIVRYHVVETGGAEPQFDQMRVKGFERIDLYALFAEHPDFRYCQSWDDGLFCEETMLAGWLKAKRSLGEFTLFAMLYQSRLDMLASVLNNERYTLEQLGLEER